MHQDDFQSSRAFVEFEPDGNRRMTDPAIDVIVHKVTRMATDMEKLASSIERMSEAIQRLALAEERIGQVMLQLERINKRLDEGADRFKDNEDKVREIEMEIVASKHTAVWVDRAVVGMVTAVAVFVAHKVGLV